MGSLLILKVEFSGECLPGNLSWSTYPARR